MVAPSRPEVASPPLWRRQRYAKSLYLCRSLCAGTIPKCILHIATPSGMKHQVRKRSLARWKLRRSIQNDRFVPSRRFPDLQNDRSYSNGSSAMPPQNGFVCVACGVWNGRFGKLFLNQVTLSPPSLTSLPAPRCRRLCWREEWCRRFVRGPEAAGCGALSAVGRGAGWAGNRCSGGRGRLSCFAGCGA